jgi:acyl carrier protein
MNTISTPAALKMLSEAFEEPLENLAPDTDRDSIAGWDSMGALTLMAELDERFGIVLTAEQSLQMSKIAHVLDLLRQHGALAD